MSTYYERNRETLLKKQKNRDAARRAEVALYQQEYRLKNREKLLEYSRDYYAHNAEEMKARQRAYYNTRREYYRLLNASYYQTNKTELISYQRAYYNTNREPILEKKRAYYDDNKADFLRRNAQRRAVEKRATPRWANLQAMANVYKQCIDKTIMTGISHHVHHIIPLRDDPTVCGLHCEANLIVVTEQKHWELHRSCG